MNELQYKNRHIYYHRKKKNKKKKNKLFNSKVLIVFLKLFNVDELRTGIGIEFHSFGAEYEYNLSNKEERDLGKTNAPLTDDLSVWLWVSETGFSRSVIYWSVKLFRAL